MHHFTSLWLQVLQKQMDLELELFGDLKDKSGSSAIGKVFMLSLSSQPVDHEDASGERQKVSDNDAAKWRCFV
jgi:hypothetical protein